MMLKMRNQMKELRKELPTEELNLHQKPYTYI